MAMLAAALNRLSDDLGDTHKTGANELAAACLDPSPVCHGFLAISGDALLGAALVSPIFSTTKGAMGVYVSDLWVDPALRGKGLGRRLLRKVALFGTTRWNANFLKLTVYSDNTKARHFYQKLGFQMAEKDQSFFLAGPQMKSLTGGGE